MALLQFHLFGLLLFYYWYINKRTLKSLNFDKNNKILVLRIVLLKFMRFVFFKRGDL